MSEKKINKIVLAYWGLTRCDAALAEDQYQCEVVCCADGSAEMDGLDERPKRPKLCIRDLREEFVRDYVGRR